MKFVFVVITSLVLSGCFAQIELGSTLYKKYWLETIE